MMVGIGFKVHQEGCIWREKKPDAGQPKGNYCSSFLKNIRLSEVSIRKNDEAKVGSIVLERGQQSAGN